MNDKKKERAKMLGAYISKHACTVRDAAKEFGLGKSTVHTDVTERLPEIDPTLAANVRKVLDYNLSVRHLRGGEATRKKSKQKNPE